VRAVGAMRTTCLARRAVYNECATSELMSAAVKLPFSFDRARLKSALAEIEDGEWMPHFNSQYYEGEWSGVALRSTNASASLLYPEPTKKTVTYADTPLLEGYNYFSEVLSTFECPLEAVRLLRLGAGSQIREHRDFSLGVAYGVVRLHVPIQTSAEIKFFLDNERVLMQEGECWYLDLSLPHRVENLSKVDRIHLVIDCVVNDWVKSLIE
jgi:mannose-6-phosphate isomerase-like protein (cupin superfamily)